MTSITTWTQNIVSSLPWWFGAVTLFALLVLDGYMFAKWGVRWQTLAPLALTVGAVIKLWPQSPRKKPEPKIQA